MTTAAICAFGEVSRSPSHYRGEQYDSDLGLYYLRARYYNPATGRFLSRDPEMGKQRKPVTLHKYLYAGSDPINMRDPSGRDDTAETAWNFANAITTTVIVVCSEVVVMEFFIWEATREGAFPEPVLKPCEGVDAALLTSEGLFWVWEGLEQGLP
jgi:RHS repeat-associated protein